MSTGKRNRVQKDLPSSSAENYKNEIEDDDNASIMSEMSENREDSDLYNNLLSIFGTKIKRVLPAGPEQSIGVDLKQSEGKAFQYNV